MTFKSKSYRVTNTAQKMKFSVKDFFSKCDQIHKKLEEPFNGKVHFLSSDLI